MPLEKMCSCVVRLQPTAMKEKIMDIIREDQLFEVDATLSQQTHEIDGLTEVDVAIVVAVNEKYR